MSPVMRYIAAEARGWMIAVLVLVFELLDLVESGSHWLGDTVLTMETIGASIIIAGPLVTASVAVDTSRHDQSTLGHLAATAPKGSRHPVAVLGATLVPVVVVHLVVGLVVLALGRPPIDVLGQTQPWLAISLQIAVLTWFALFGLLVGHLTSPVLAGIAGIVAGYTAILTFGNTGYVGDSPLLDAGNALTPQIGRGFDVMGMAIRIALIAGIIVATFMTRRILASKTARTATYGTWAVLVGLLAATAFIDLPDRRVPISAQADACVTGQATTICVYPEHRRHVTRWLGVVDVLVQAATEAGYQAWDYPKLTEWIPPLTSPPDTGATFLVESFDQVSGGGAAPSEWVASIITPVKCLAALDPNQAPPVDFDRVQERMVFTWIGLLGTGATDTGVDPLSPHEVNAVADAWSRCDLAFTP